MEALLKNIFGVVMLALSNDMLHCNTSFSLWIFQEKHNNIKYDSIILSYLNEPRQEACVCAQYQRPGAEQIHWLNINKLSWFTTIVHFKMSFDKWLFINNFQCQWFTFQICYTDHLFDVSLIV